MQILSLIKKTFSFDDRSMGLYRIFLGMIVMADVLYRWEDITNLYTDVGLIPRSLFTGEMTMPWSLSFHLANGSTPFIVFMFSLHLIFGLMILFGYKTRWATLGAYVMTVSVHNRNWLVNNGGDDILRAFIFLSVFLPLGRRFSIDSALDKDKAENKDYFSTWGLTFFLQIFVIYFVSYILKDHPIWRTDYTATFYSSRLDIFTTPLGYIMRDYPNLLKFITAFSIYLEEIGPLLLIFSFVFGRFWWIPRLMLVTLFIGFHFGIFLTMDIGIFTFICETMWIIFIPGPFWDKLGDFFRKRHFDKLKIYFDGECGFCQKGVRIIKSFLLFREVPLLVAQDTPSVYADMTKNNSWVVVNENGDRFFRYDAFIEILKHSPVGRPFVFLFASAPVSFIGGKVYHWVSNHRPTMSKVSQFLVYREPKKDIAFFRWIFEAAGAFIFVTILCWNLTTIKKLNFRAPFFQNVTRWIHLYQEWNMFAPYPKMDNVWLEIPAVLSDGTEIELLTGSKDLYSIKDKAFYKTIRNDHWRKFYLNLSDKVEYARYFGGYLCRTWNDRKAGFVKDTTLRKMEIIVYSQPNLPDGGKGGITRKLSWKHWCFDEDFKRDNPPR